MTKLVTFFVLIVVLALLLPQANADFSKIPIFDLKTSSDVASNLDNLGGGMDAIYTLYLENGDQSENVVSVSITIPIGYSIGPGFITNETGIIAMSGYGSNPQLGTTQLYVVTTNTPGRFLISAMGATLGEITVIEPTTTPGRMEMKFSGVIAVMNHGCSAEIKSERGFFINPWQPGTYVWAPSTANPESGESVTMEPRSGLSQAVEIVPFTLGWRRLANTTSLATTEIQSSIAMETVATTSAVGFAIIGIGAGVAAAAGGLAVAISQPRSEVYVFAGYYYCRKHRVPVWFIDNRPWCPIERKFLGN